MKDILSLISRVQEIKLNQQIGLMDSRIHGCGQPGQQASVAIQGAESICLTTEICFSSLSAPASSSTLWWSNSLAPDWARLNLTSRHLFSWAQVYRAWGGKETQTLLRQVSNHRKSEFCFIVATWLNSNPGNLKKWSNKPPELLEPSVGFKILQFLLLHYEI